MSRLTGKKVLLGVCGGIAAYKAAELVRLLRAEAADVKVVMTRSATAFVTPLTFQALSGQPVALELLDSAEEAAMGHIRLARWADCILIAPATADFIAKLRAGSADDLLTTLCLAAESPVVLAPAMNRSMWNNPATRENVGCLRARGIRLLGPVAGPQACGETGVGRMLEPSAICAEMASGFEGVLDGVSVLVTAGPTREPIDPVRYISNRSSGKMGFAVAEAAVKAGASVSLVAGPVALPAPHVMELIEVESARQMHRAVVERARSHAIYIGTAAVADYRPVVQAPTKIKKSADRIELVLEKNDDILATVARMKGGPFTVGFAAETDDIERYAQGKMRDKALDMVAANRVGAAEGGFDSDDNALSVFWPGGGRRLEMAPKAVLAKQLIELIAERFHASRP